MPAVLITSDGPRACAIDERFAAREPLVKKLTLTYRVLEIKPKNRVLASPEP